MKFRSISFPYQGTYIALQVISLAAMIIFGVVQGDAMTIVRYLAIAIILEIARRIDAIVRNKD